MERTRYRIPVQDRYPIEQEPIILSKQMLDEFLKQENGADLISLYCFYYHTAKWQHTIQPRSTTAYTAKGIGWSEGHVRRIKHQLRKMGLIEDVNKRDSTGQIIGHFVRICTISSIPTPTIPHSVGNRQNEPKNIPTPMDSHTVGNREGNAYIMYNNKIYTSKSDFSKFWNLYPRKVGRGAAEKSWERICKLPKDIRPSWREIKKAVLLQIKSEQWQTTQYIPHPATWLNQHRWLDEVAPPKINGNSVKGKPAFIIDDGIRYNLSEDGYYRHCETGEIFIP